MSEVPKGSKLSCEPTFTLLEFVNILVVFFVPAFMTITLPLPSLSTSHPITAKGNLVHVSHLSLDELVIFWNSVPPVELQSQISDGSNESYDFVEYQLSLTVRIGNRILLWLATLYEEAD